MAFTGRQLLKNVAQRMNAPKKAKKRASKNPLMTPGFQRWQHAEDSQLKQAPLLMQEGAGFNNGRDINGNIMPKPKMVSKINFAKKGKKMAKMARKGKKAAKRKAKKLPAKPVGTGPWDRSQRDSDDNLRAARKPKPQGRGIVKALGQKKTTGNFAKIAKKKGKAAAIGALQNKLAKRRGQPIPYHRAKKGKKASKRYAHKGHTHMSRKAMKEC